MENHPRTSRSMLYYSDQRVAAMVNHFRNVVGLSLDPHDPTKTAVQSYQMEVQTAALINAAEDLTTLTRQMKEAWVFGRLDTLGVSEAEKRTEVEARKVMRKVEGLMRGGEEERTKEGNEREGEMEVEGG